jgi:hypothetical protein
MHATGIHVGNTTSGKPIYSSLMNEEPRFPHPRDRDFSIAEHYESYAVFAYLAQRARKRWGEDSEEYLFYYQHAAAPFEGTDIAENLISLRLAAGIGDAFDELKLGRKLSRSEFRDL